MRTRMNTKVDVTNVIQQIEIEIRAYSKAVRTIMLLKKVEYKDAKRILEMRLTERLIFKTA